jgi:hypothetical protein
MRDNPTHGDWPLLRPLVVRATDLVFTTLNPLMGSEKGHLSRGFRVDQDLAENWCPARLGSG